ncbi:MAG: hypothetical protein ACT4P4_17010 [Betaproteobacteria bacterium]
MRICVMAYRRATGEEQPSAFYLGGRRLPVSAIVERWSEGTARYYEVRIEDGRRFVLRHDPPTGAWSLAAVYAASAARSASRHPAPVLRAETPR